MMVDVLHLLIIATGIGVGVWALIALRTTLPRGRFMVFTAASAGSLFGCAALSGEVGLLPPVAWFAVVMAVMSALIVTGKRLARAPATWR